MTLPAQQLYQKVTVSVPTTIITVIFQFLNPDNLVVRVDGIVTNLYSVDMSNNTVTFNSALLAGSVVEFYTDVPYANEFDFTNSSQWNSDEVNNKDDNFQLQIQQVVTQVSFLDVQAIKIPEDNLDTLLPDAPTRANKAIKFDASGNVEVTQYDPDEVVNEAQVYANQAQQSAQNANQDAQNAQNYATSASNSADLASEWAEGPDNNLPNGAKSAKTWAEASAQIAIPDGSITDVKLAEKTITNDKLNGIIPIRIPINNPMGTTGTFYVEVNVTPYVPAGFLNDVSNVIIDVSITSIIDAMAITILDLSIDNLGNLIIKYQFNVSPTQPNSMAMFVILAKAEITAPQVPTPA